MEDERHQTIRQDLGKLVRDYRTENYFSTRTAIGSGVCSMVGMLSLCYAGTQNKTALYVGLGAMGCSIIFSLTRLAYDFFHMNDFYVNLETLAETVNKNRESY